MDYRATATIFVTVFLAELGDKTQLATLLFAADKPLSRWVVFLAAASALVLSTALAVLAGGWIAEHIDPRYLKLAAGLGFMVIGAWTLRSAYV